MWILATDGMLLNLNRVATIEVLRNEEGNWSLLAFPTFDTSEHAEGFILFEHAQEQAVRMMRFTLMGQLNAQVIEPLNATVQ